MQPPSAHRRFLLGVCVCLATIASAVSSKGGDAPPATFAVEVVANAGQPQWLATALGQKITLELEAFARLQSSKSTVPNADCAAERWECRAQNAATKNIDLLVLATLEAGRLSVHSIDTRRRETISERTVNLAPGLDSNELRRGILTALQPIVGASGWLDGRLANEPSPTASSTPENATPQVPAALPILGAVLLLMVLPWLLLRRRLRGAARTPTAKLAMAVVVLCVAAIGVLLLARDHPLLAASEAWGSAMLGKLWLQGLLGGLGWGALLLVYLRLAWPPLHGLTRVQHDNLRLLLTAWGVDGLSRTLRLAVLFAPVVALFVLVPHALVRMVVVPLLGLALCAWYAMLVDLLSASLDGKLVVGRADRDNPWHLAASKYFWGYVRRGGIDLDRRKLDHVLFLPGQRDGCYVYGGGATPIRVVLGRDLLELALGPVAEQDELEQSTAVTVPDADAWEVGTLQTVDAAPESPRAVARQLRKRQQGDASLRRRRSRARARGRVRPQPRLLGRNETLLGYVLPQVTYESVPLISNDDEDYSVVRQLLTAHYAAFAGSPYDDDYDDTDPTQKDFLFGGLLRCVGLAQRNAGLMASLSLSIGLLFEGVPERWRPRVAKARSALRQRRWLSGTIVADAFVVLNQGRDYLLQFLQVLHTSGPHLLTVRADTPRLISTSRKILSEVAKKAANVDAETAAEHRLVERLRWIGRSLHVELGFAYSPRARLVFVALCTLLPGLALLWLIGGALAYHPIYVERMADIRLQIAQQQSSQPEATGAPTHGR